ncbi:hypothetical protein BRD18_06485 [Halobacteriales archaeon SW_7_71_33]|nr:MAG: hypothetical protein BRD18_06485 [Halobacteriales archaeon SW_7_71_33]
MRRRELCERLGAACAVGLAGCVGRADHSDRPIEMLRTITIVSQTSVERADTRVTATLVDDEITCESTAVVELSLLNTADDERRYGFLGPIAPFSDLVSEPEGWALYAVDDDQPRKVEDCWQRSDDATQVMPSVTSGRTLDAGESVTRRYEFRSRADCMPTGRYEFVGRFDVPHDERVRWSFTVEVE